MTHVIHRVYDSAHRVIRHYGYPIIVGGVILALFVTVSPAALGVACVNWTNVALLRFYFQGGRLDHANPTLCAASSAASSDPQRWTQGMGSYLHGDIASAEQQFTAALASQPEYGRTLRIDQALSYTPLIWHDHPESVDFMVEYARQHGHTSPIGYMRLAQFYLSLSDITKTQVNQERIRSVLEIISRTTLQGYQPRVDRAVALFHLGEYYSGRDTELAIRAYQAVVAEDPKDTSQGCTWVSAMKIVEYSIQRQDWEHAYALLSYAEALPDLYHRYSYTRLRLAQLDTGQYGVDKAIADLEQTILRDPSFTPTRMYLASLYQKKGLLSVASEQYQTVLLIEPDNQEAQQALIILRHP